MSVPLRRLRETPRHLLVCEKSHVRHERSRHAAHVRSHPYNCRVSLLIPECGILPEALKSVITDIGEYYLVKNLFLHELITHEFINTYVKKGSCYALTYNTKIDQDNAAALLPTGKLIISVDKDTYEELGLQGCPSQYFVIFGLELMDVGKQAYNGNSSEAMSMAFAVITIDLTDSAFDPDSKKYKRVLWALKEKKPLQFDFLLSWHNTGEERSTFMSYFSKKQIQAHQPKTTFSTLRNLQCPVLHSNELQGKQEESCSAQELFDWLGAVFNNVGFCYFDEPKLAQWVTLTVHGFADSPVSWRESEHGFQKGGENLYNFVVFRNLDYWLQMAVGANDDCPP